MNTVKLISSVKNLVAPCEYVNIKHRNDGGCLKMDEYSWIGLLADLSRIKHTLSPVRWHSVWNIELFLMHYNLAIRTFNLFSLSLSLWCSIARWNECVSDVSIPVAAWFKAWVCDRSFAAIGVLGPTEGVKISRLWLCAAR